MVAIGQNVVEILIRARDQFTAVFNKASLSLQSFRKSALIAAAAGVAIVAGFGKAIKTSIDFETAFTGVRKTVELTEEGFADLEQRFKDLSKTTPITFVELSRIGELAGQLGVEGVDNLEKFTKTIAQISVTTNLTAEAAATEFARLANIMQEPLENIDRMGATIVDLGNNFATTEAEISTFAQRMAGAAKIVGFSTSDTYALGAALSSVGVKAEAGGTAVQMALLKIDEAVITGGEKLEVFAKTSGMTIDEFKQQWEIDAAGAFEKFISGLGASGDGAAKILQDVGLANARTQRSFLSLANAPGLLADALETARIAWEENKALEEEANKRFETLAAQLKIAKNYVLDMADAIGDKLTPFIENYLIPALIWLTTTWDNLSPGMQDAILIIGGVTAAVTLLAGAVALVTFAFGPWLLVIGAVIAIITGLILAIKHSGDIMIKLTTWTLQAAAVMDKVWQWVKDGFIIVWNIIKNVFISMWDKMISYYEGAINTILTGINAVIRGINKMPGINIPLIPKVDLSGVKGQLTNIDDLKASLGFEREIRARQFGEATQQVMVNIENIYGTDPDEISEALNETLKDKIST